nr:S-layer homology domain-containing protein [Paenibacillus hamazuiensis]
MLVDLPTDNNALNQQFIVRFYTDLTFRTFVESRYDFSFQQYDRPAVAYVERVIGGVTTKLNNTGVTQINSLPADLNIYVNSPTTYVKVKLNGVDYNDNVGGHAAADDPSQGKVYAVEQNPALQVKDDKGNIKVPITLQGIPDGAIKVQVVPYTGALGSLSRYPAGQKNYDITLFGSPYVILSNIYNGMSVKSLSELYCGSTPVGPCIEGRFVNFTPADYDAVVSINGKELKPVTLDGAGNFKITDFKDKDNNDIPNLFADGKKTIKVSIYRKNASGTRQLVTETSVDIFVFSQQVPVIQAFEPKDNTKFKPGANPDTYVTDETEVVLTGSILNADIASGQYTITYNQVGSTTQVVLKTAGTDFPVYTGMSPQTFETKKIPLPKYGDYTFRLDAKTGNGSVSKTITISRQATPYIIMYPPVFTNETGNVQANINKNFQEILIRADGADNIVFGKDTVLKSQDYTNMDVFKYEAKQLKAGQNSIKFTINRGTTKQSGTLILNNVDTAIEGAQAKLNIANKMKVFGGDLEISFPKDTKLMRNDMNPANQFVSADRDLFFGIASLSDYGAVDKSEDANGDDIEDLNDGASRDKFNDAAIDRFKPASKLFWVDGGTIPDPTSTTVDLKDALQGSGTLPLPRSGVEYYSRDFEDTVIPNKQGTITLKYDPSIRGDSWKYLSIFELTFVEKENGEDDPPEMKWKNLGGKIDTSKNTITATFDKFGYFMVMYMYDSFDDVRDHAWARDDLDMLYSRFIMMNKSPGDFLPNDAISRGEFVTMLVKIYDIPLENRDTTNRSADPQDPSSKGTFSDVQRGENLLNSNGLYDFVHIEAAARAGIVRGTDSGAFLPGESIKRKDAAQMLARAANLKLNNNITNSIAALTKQFTDAPALAASDRYAVPAVEAVVKAGFMQGIENSLLPGQKKATYRFEPELPMTRAEAAVIATRILRQLKKIP